MPTLFGYCIAALLGGQLVGGAAEPPRPAPGPATPSCEDVKRPVADFVKGLEFTKVKFVLECGGRRFDDQGRVVQELELKKCKEGGRCWIWSLEWKGELESLASGVLEDPISPTFVLRYLLTWELVEGHWRIVGQKLAGIT